MVLEIKWFGTVKVPTQAGGLAVRTPYKAA